MAQPRAYTQTNTFNDWTTTNPSDPHIGSKFDTEFTELKQNTDDLNTNIALIQRDDGKIKNEAIHKDSFDQDALALIGASGNGFTPKGDWAATTAYVAGDIVNNNDATYLTATASHTSGSTFTGDQATYWTLIANSAISTSNASVDTTTSTSGQTVFPTTYTYSNTKDIQVYQNGVLTATTLYSISNSGGNNITLNTAPATGTVVIIWGDAVVAQQAKAATLGYKDTTNNHKTTAERWANHTGSVVTDAETSSASSEYSAKEYAIGTTVAVGSSKDWAVQAEDSAVTGSSYSALHHAAKSSASATASASSATASASSATASASSASAAATSETNAAASYDLFDDRFLGTKSSDPTQDNDSNALVDGCLYFNTTNNVMMVYDLGGTAWLRTTPTSSDQTSINTVNANATNINTVAGINANVTTVAGISANVTTVATNNANVTTVATNVAGVNSFAERYRVAASAPSSSLDEGDLYYNTTDNTLRYYDGTIWTLQGQTEAQTITIANNAAVAMSIALG